MTINIVRKTLARISDCVLISFSQFVVSPICVVKRNYSSPIPQSIITQSITEPGAQLTFMDIWTFVSLLKKAVIE